MVNATVEKFPHAVRVVRSADYRAIYDAGGKIYSSNFVLFSRRNALGRSRLGITVSRKVGGAVVRNRVKRLFREIFRRSSSQIPSPFDMVVNAKAGCAKAGYDGLRAEFLVAMRKLGDRKGR
ncbi:MAG: ribonuclease P protein component [Acidobacteriota bacterium]|nr:ribonuclease P protein component [Acidobacteriota bacterium]